MDAGVAHEKDSVAERCFVTEADWIPGFWNYLLDLDRDDLVAELIQNDLDQDATRTVISFEEDRLVCEGNGKPVEAEGWLRLRKIQGAGHSVPAKRGKIGVKNHGLKTAFTVGDELQVLSAGQSIIQTLYRDGRNKPPYPGASREPTVDKHAQLMDAASSSGIADTISNLSREKRQYSGRSATRTSTPCSWQLARARRNSSPASCRPK